MIASLKARWRTSALTASHALYWGMLTAALLAVMLVIAFRACAPSPSATQQHINQPAITFTLTAEQAGELLPSPVTFASTPGKPTLLVFFYTLCTHCLLEMQSARTVASTFPDLRSVYIDSPAERPNLADILMRRLAITDPVLLDTDGRVAARYHIAYYPAFVLIDRHGIVRNIWIGEVDASALRVGIAQALATSANR